MPDKEYKLICNICNHKWNQRKKGDFPKRCPFCRSPNWNKKRIKDLISFIISDS